MCSYLSDDEKADLDEALKEYAEGNTTPLEEDFSLN